MTTNSTLFNGIKMGETRDLEHTNTSPTMSQLQVLLESTLSEFRERFESTGKIAQNTNAISELKDAMAALSKQLKQMKFAYSSRLIELEFPKFNGDDLNSWLYRVELLFELDNVPDATKVPLAAYHLEGKAFNWHRAFMNRRNDVDLSWSEYSQALTARFGDSFDDLMLELKNLRQTASVEEYRDAFDNIICKLELPNEFVLSFFLAGLEDEIKYKVRMFDPKSLEHAYRLAKLQEAAT